MLFDVSALLGYGYIIKSSYLDELYEALEEEMDNDKMFLLEEHCIPLSGYNSIYKQDLPVFVGSLFCRADDYAPVGDMPQEVIEVADKLNKTFNLDAHLLDDKESAPREYLLLVRSWQKIC